MNIKNEIKSWGLPDALRDIEVDYVFCDLGAGEFGKKFYLNDKDGNEIFKMDFFDNSDCIFLTGEKLYMTLNFIYIPNPKYRQKGIAGFFLDNLLEYTKKCGLDEIHLHVAPNAEAINKENLEKAMNKNQLKKFYAKHLGQDPTVKLVFDEYGSDSKLDH